MGTNRRSQLPTTVGPPSRMIQLIAILILAPLIAILGLEGSLSGEGTGTLLGTIVGLCSRRYHVTSPERMKAFSQNSDALSHSQTVALLRSGGGVEAGLVPAPTLA